MSVYLDDGDVKILLGDAADVLPSLPVASVDAIVTSPPYADARSDYDHVEPDAFPSWLAGMLDLAVPALAPSGSLFLNLGRLFRDGQELDYLERTLAVLASRGWYRIDTVLWWKPNAPARSGPYLTNAHEFAYWLARTAQPYRGLDDARQPYAEATLARYSRRWARNTRVKGSHVEQSGRTPNPLGARPQSVFVETVGREKGNPHPAPMPLALAEYLVALACPPGGLVLDPFAGSGTTGLAARRLGRRAILVEKDEEWAASAAVRLSQQTLEVA